VILGIKYESIMRSKFNPMFNNFRNISE